ncbi:MAG: sulfotransferase family protein [Gammaproteobacteria bacterium]
MNACPSSQVATGRLPTFLLIGAMKAGTTSLYHYLSMHPQVYMPSVKEPDFFAEAGNWRRGLAWYCKQFAPAGPDALAVGEASTVYSKYPRYPGVPQRIAGVIPDVRLIYVLRDPIARIRSHYQHRVAEGSERMPFAAAVFENPIYIDYSRYAMQIEQYLEHFPREQLLVITLEAMRDDRGATMRQVYAHLGVNAAFNPGDFNKEFYKTNARAARSLIPLGMRKRLKKHFPASKRAVEWEANWLGLVNRLGRWGSAAANRTEAFEISAEVRKRLSDNLCEDMQKLRAYMGAGFDAWGIG